MAGLSIVYCSDRNFIKHTAVSMISLLENKAEDTELTIYLLESGLADRDREKLLSMVGSYGEKASLKLVKLSELSGLLDKKAGTKIYKGRFGAIALARIFAPELIKDEKRLLYIDSDTLIRGDLRELWKTKLSDPELAAMAMEPTIYPEVRKSLSLGPSEPYFNSGVILMDAEGWRREKIADLALSAFKKQEDLLLFPDQDILNLTLRGRIKPLPQSCNFFTAYIYQSYEALCKYAPWFRTQDGKEVFERAKSAPLICHFAGDERPWIKGSFCPKKDEYRYYRSLTPYKDEPDEGGKRLYMLVYHMLNLLTKLMPKLRYYISELYYRLRRKKEEDADRRGDT